MWISSGEPVYHCYRAIGLYVVAECDVSSAFRSCFILVSPELSSEARLTFLSVEGVWVFTVYVCVKNLVSKLS